MQTRPRALGSSASERAADVISLNDNKAQRRTDREHHLRATNVSRTKKRSKTAERFPAHQRHSTRPSRPSRPPRAGSRSSGSLPPPFRPPSSQRVRNEREGGCAHSRPVSSAPPAVPSRPPACGTARAAAAQSRGRERAEGRPRIEPGTQPCPAAPRRAGSDVPPPRKGGRCAARLSRRSHVAAVSGGRRGRHGARRGEVRGSGAAVGAERRGCGCAPPWRRFASLSLQRPRAAQPHPAAPGARPNALRPRE